MSNNQHDHYPEFQQQLAAYALGERELDPALRTHLADCALCQQTLREYMQVARVLPYAAPDIAPPTELRDRILAMASNQMSGPVTVVATQRTQRPPAQPPRQRLAWPSFVFACALVLALLAWNLSIQARLAEQIAEANASDTRLQAIESLLSAPDVQSYPLSGTAGSGRVWASNERNQAYFVAEGLPNPGNGNVYQIWLIQGDAPSNAGTFETQGGRAAMVVAVPGSLIDFGTFGVTIEPRGGSAAPTSPPILLGSLEASAPLPVADPLVSFALIPASFALI